jgi:hypothetical protein
MRHALLVVLAVAAGCTLTTSSSGGGSTMPRPGGGGGGGASTASGGGSDNRGEEERPTEGIKGAIVRSQLEKIRGMTVPEAKKFLSAQYGFTGDIKVYTLQQHVANCEKDRICSWDSESGIGIHDDLTVYTNLIYESPTE